MIILEIEYNNLFEPEKIPILESETNILFWFENIIVYSNGQWKSEKYKKWFEKYTNRYYQPIIMRMILSQ